MTRLRSLLPPSLLLSAFAIGSAPAQSQDAPITSGQNVEIAQRGENREDDKKERGRSSGEDRGRRAIPMDRGQFNNKDKAPDRNREGARQERQPDKKPDKVKAPEPKKERETPRPQNTIQRKLQEPEGARPERGGRDMTAPRRDNDGRPSRRDLDQTRDRAPRRDDERARQDAEKVKSDAARREAEQRRQAEEQKARDNAARDKQGAEQRRRDAERGRPDADRNRRGEGERDATARDRFRARQEGREPRKFDRTRADQEFERARREAEQRGGGKGPGEAFRPDGAKRFEELRRGRKSRDVGSRQIITEPDKRTIFRDDKRTIIRHDENARFSRKGREQRRERRKDGLWTVVTAGLAGAMIYSILDDDGRVVRRSRRDRDGREYVIFDDRRHYHRDHRGSDYRPAYVDLPPPVVRIPRDRYIVDYERASYDDVYDALSAPPVDRLDRGYSLDEIRYNYSILERMRRVDLDAINFTFGSWDVGEDQYRKLESMSRAIHRVLERSPNELFLIEGHTDAVGSDIDNLSLSDRRAETVAAILTDTFDVPPENLATQGYGEEYLKELTDGPSRINRRVAVRRITPLLARDGWNDPM